MKNPSRSRLQLIYLLCLGAMMNLPCAAFVTANKETSLVAAVFRSNDSLHSKDPHSGLSKIATFPRHGGGNKRKPPTELRALQDFSAAASGLFGNLIGPASMIAGGLVPLGFLAGDIPGDSPSRKRLKAVYFLIAIISLANELMAIMYATVASNKLTETVVAPAASVFALLQRDYELSWIGTNVHFMAGLFGFMAMVGIRAYAFLPKNVNVQSTGIAASFFLAMLSVVNRGIAEGNRQGQVFGSSLIGLVALYMKLLFIQSVSRSSPLSIGAGVLGVGSTVWVLWALFYSEE